MQLRTLCIVMERTLWACLLSAYYNGAPRVRITIVVARTLSISVTRGCSLRAYTMAIGSSGEEDNCGRENASHFAYSCMLSECLLQ